MSGVGLFTEIDNPPAAFWNRRSAAFAMAGLVCYGVSRWLFQFDSTAALVLTSVLRLSPLLPFAGGLRAWPIVLATPYPFDLAFAAYSERGKWLPEALAMEASNPTAFLIFVSGAMFVSLLLTGWLLARSVTDPVDGPLRYLRGLLFLLTAFAAVLPNPLWTVAAMRYLVEPVAVAGFAAVLGFGTRALH